jgi:endonuclease/exonuclease/phosphatase family metal-dependent hydrolase
MRIVTWNTQWCKGIDGVVDVQRILDHARALGDFDVLCLQEIAQNYPGLTGPENVDQPLAIAKLLPDFEVVFGPCVDERPNKGLRQRFGNLIASRLPILQVQHLALPSPCERGDSFSWMPRQCTVCTLDTPMGAVRVMTTHLEYYSASQRLAQAQTLRSWHQTFIDQYRYPPVLEAGDACGPYQAKPLTEHTILCGDFNCEPNSPGYLALTTHEKVDALIDAWCIAHPQRTHRPTFRLYDDRYGPDAISCDFFFVSESLRDSVHTVSVDADTQASDHQPVTLTLS